MFATGYVMFGALIYGALILRSLQMHAPAVFWILLIGAAGAWLSYAIQLDWGLNGGTASMPGFISLAVTGFVLLSIAMPVIAIFLLL